MMARNRHLLIMSSTSLLHPALGESLGGVALAQARLQDQQRLAVLLQGAALLAHLEHGGLFLLRGWETARIRDEALLAVHGVAQGKSAESLQTLLLDLLERLFPRRDERGEITGKGTARNVARQLHRRWDQRLAPLSSDQAVAEILDLAPFLWQPSFAEARTALLGEHRNGDRSHLWIAGPGRNRRRVLGLGKTREDVENAFRGSEARGLWDGWSEDADPEALARDGRFHRAVAAWRRRPPRKSGEVLLFGTCLYALGLFSQAEDLLKRRNDFKASLLRLKCLGESGRHEAARQLLLRIGKSELSGPETLSLAEAAVRILARKGDFELSREWVNRAFRAGRRGRLARRAELLAAEAAWDRRDLDAMARYLGKARRALDDPELARRWHEVRSLLAVGRRDGAAVVEHSTAVLRFRRSMTPTEAGRRWNDLAYGRLLLGDLAGTERALRHTMHLLNDTESASRDTLGLSNTAGIRLRRGNLDGVIDALRSSTEKNRKLENHRGQVGDLELWVRFELAQGRPQEALARCKEAIELIGRHGVGDRQVFDLFAARAHGWLGRPERAADCLSRVSPEILFELEPEERPAVWALAGQAEQAAREAADTPWSELWSAHQAGLHPDPGVWETLETLERFRAARLVFDYLTVAPEAVPPIWSRRAVDGFRSMEAFSFADRVERRFLSPWRAVEGYLESSKNGGDDIDELLRSAGYPEARLTLREGGRETLVRAGVGGGEVLDCPCSGGRLVLEAPWIDAPLRALFHLIRRDVKRPAGPRRRRRKRPLSEHGIVGDCPALRKAFDKLDRLAAGELSILILGESGTGKELAARRVHDLSPRNAGPFTPANCASLPEENLVQSELFGHIRGAYTGADKDRRGIFEQSRRGTVFLDELGDLPLSVQGKLLRVLQEGELRRMGDHVDRKIDVRVVAATHRNLRKMVRDGRFRQDLYFRLKGAIVELPPLRDRGDDVLLVAEYLLDRHWRSLGPRQGPPPKISPDAKAALLRHSWQGNVRELDQAVKHAATFSAGRDIRVEDLDLPEEQGGDKGSYHQQLERFKQQVLGDAIAQAGGNLAAAARRVGLTRQALSYLARKHDLL